MKPVTLNFVRQVQQKYPSLLSLNNATLPQVEFVCLNFSGQDIWCYQINDKGNIVDTPIARVPPGTPVPFRLLGSIHTPMESVDQSISLRTAVLISKTPLLFALRKAYPSAFTNAKEDGETPPGSDIPTFMPSQFDLEGLLRSSNAINSDSRYAAPQVAFAAMTRVLSCIQPSGQVHLGNYLGALRNWVVGQHECDAFHGIVDLHAMTSVEEPGAIGTMTIELAAEHCSPSASTPRSPRSSFNRTYPSTPNSPG